MTLDAAEALELARSNLCVGCAGPLTPPGGNGLWCGACWRVFLRTGELPDLLDGGRALRPDG